MKRAAFRWPRRWCTPTQGMPSRQAMALLAEKVVSREPTRPGPLGDGDAVQGGQGQPGLGQGALDDPAQLEQVLPGRQFRHHAAVGAVQLVLALAGHGQRAPGPRAVSRTTAAEQSSQEDSRPSTSIRPVYRTRASHRSGGWNRQRQPLQLTRWKVTRPGQGTRSSQPRRAVCRRRRWWKPRAGRPPAQAPGGPGLHLHQPAAQAPGHQQVQLEPPALDVPPHQVPAPQPEQPERGPLAAAPALGGGRAAPGGAGGEWGRSPSRSRGRGGFPLNSAMAASRTNVDRSPALQRKLADLPTQPGVYLYRDQEGNLLYVGKAKVLRNRVKSYFQSKQLDGKTRRLVARIWDLEFVVCETELEALVLENNLIQEHRPPYNIMLRDDKSYPYVKLTWKDPFPQVFVTRKVKKDGSLLLRPLLPRPPPPTAPRSWSTASSRSATATSTSTARGAGPA